MRFKIIQVLDYTGIVYTGIGLYSCWIIPVSYKQVLDYTGIEIY